MKLTLEALQVLDAIDRKGSFAAAAAEMFRVPSAITYTIQQLEQDLDVALFDRDGRRARLTPAGFELLNEGRHLLRAASDIECRIQQVAKGWETELVIAVDTILGAQCLYPLIGDFLQLNSGTRIKVSEEVLGGNWDALVSNRAQLVVGAAGDVPPGGGFATLPLTHLSFVFAVAPDHPLASEPQPLPAAVIVRHRAVAVADSSRTVAPRSSGLLSGQDTFTVPSMAAKASAQIAGLGVGYLPAALARREAAAGRLCILEVEALKPGGDMVVAWRPNRTGKALRWFVQQLEKPEVKERILRDVIAEPAAVIPQARAKRPAKK
ncbi:MAG: LysR family transcriptional regulator [Betaproteobacteria bacterium]|nr:LysR family transcriptional regulator [Betaproteobacteria bacterium]